MQASEVHLIPITVVARMLKTGAVTSTALTRACLEQIERRNAQLRAFVTVMAENAMEQAQTVDREIADGVYRGPLHGVPVSVKDMIDVAGVPTTAASRVRDGHVARSDASVVMRLREAGAVFVGKCNLHEFAFGTTSEESAYGAVLNPSDTTRSAGGSSGGSAVAVATGMCFASVGTDTGGSIRIPSAACGTVGLKPTYGELSCDGVVPLSRSLDHVGPLTRSVADASLLCRIMAHGPGAGDVPASDSDGPAAPHIGVPRAYFFDLLDDEVRTVVEAAFNRLMMGAGWRTDVVEIRHAEHIAPIYLNMILPEASAYHSRTLQSRPGDYTPGVRLRLEMGRHVLAEDYLRALKGCEVLRREVDEALRGRHALALPTLPVAAPKLGASTVRAGGIEQPVRDAMLRLTQLFNLTGHPAITIPCGKTAEGLPCGLQLVGRRGRTTELLTLAHRYESVIRGTEGQA